MATPISFTLPDILHRKYVLLERLGNGAFGVVYKVEHRRTGKFYAVKQIPFGPVGREMVRREVALTMSMDHNNVVYARDNAENTSAAYIILELCDSDLTALIDKSVVDREPFPEEQVWKIMKDLACGLSYFSGRSAKGDVVLHRDIKSDNIFVIGRGRHRRFLFGDLGLSKVLPIGGYTTSRTGTPAYAAPEQMKGERYASEVDLWGLGMVCYQAVTGKLPFDAHDARANYRYRPKPPPLPKGYSQRLYLTICKLLDYAPARRLSADELLVEIKAVETDKADEKKRRAQKKKEKKRKMEDEASSGPSKKRKV